MIIRLIMKCGDLIKIESHEDFEEKVERMLASNPEWIMVTDLEGIKVGFRSEDLKYISHE